jgi:hypothetical protein
VQPKAVALRQENAVVVVMDELRSRRYRGHWLS